MITAVKWVRKGAAKTVPLREAVDELVLVDDSDALNTGDGDNNDAMQRDDSSNEEDAMDSNEDKDDDEDDEEEDLYNMKQYNVEDNAVPGASDLKSLSQFDPYLKEDADQEELEDDMVHESDLLLCTAHCDDDQWFHVDVNLIESELDNMYVHHDLVLPSLPLALEWLDYDVTNSGGGEPGNFLAVGSFAPGIEIWNLDVMDVMESMATLGGQYTEEELAEMDAMDEASASSASTSASNLTRKQKKKKARKRLEKNHASSKKKKKDEDVMQLRPGSHTDAVLGIAWNRHTRNLLATASADKSVRLWDLERGVLLGEPLRHHRGKVQCVEWSPSDARVLLTGSFDKTCAVLDVRAPDSAALFHLSDDVECVAWSRVREQHFFASQENGVVNCFDAVRADNSPVYSFEAHRKAVSGLSIGGAGANVMATASVDGTLKIWDMRHADAPPRLLFTREFNYPIFDVEFCPDSPNFLAVAGKGPLVTLHLSKIDSVRHAMQLEEI